MVSLSLSGYLLLVDKVALSPRFYSMSCSLISLPRILYRVFLSAGTVLRSITTAGCLNYAIFYIISLYILISALGFNNILQTINNIICLNLHLICILGTLTYNWGLLLAINNYK